MTRRYKTLGLALVAVLAMGAAAASAASAQLGHFQKEKAGVTTITGEQGASKHVFSAGAHGNVQCAKAHFVGSTSATKTNELTITPTYTTCTFKGIAGTHVSMNGCSFLHTGTGELHVRCPEGNSITITVTVAGVSKCTIHIPEQTVGGITYTNSSPEKTSITVDANTTGIKYSTTMGFGAGSCTATAGATDGTYTGSVTLKGTTGGVAEGIWVT